MERGGGKETVAKAICGGEGGGLVQSMPRGGWKQGMNKGLSNYTTTVNISKITVQRGKGSFDFHNDSSVSDVG